MSTPEAPRPRPGGGGYGWGPAAPPGYGFSAGGAPGHGSAQAPGYGLPPYGGGPYGFPYPTPPAGDRSRRRSWLGTGMAAVLAAVVAGAGVVVGHAVWPGSGRAASLGPTSPSAPGAAPDAGTGTAVLADKVSAGLVNINVTLGYQQTSAAGTGMVLTAGGEVLTNNHVIQGATRISVTDIGNSRTYSATVVGYDRTHDIAVLQLAGASGLSTLTLGDSSAVQVGESVVAVGNAGGTGTPSFAAGSVTAVDQSIVAADQNGGSSQQLTGLIATNANVVAGDSGGPLVDGSGHVIGMDTAGSVRSAGRFGGGRFGGQVGAGQGFAIPINQAASIASQIEAGTSSSTVHIGATAFLGVTLADAGNGAAITSVLPGGPAAQAGLAAGDTITALDGRTVTAGQSMTDLLLSKRPGATVQVRYLDSSGTPRTAPVHLTSGPPQ